MVAQGGHDIARWDEAECPHGSGHSGVGTYRTRC